MGKLKVRSVVICLVFLFCLLSAWSILYADDADVLPKGVFSVSVDNNFYFPIHERFNPEGHVEDVAVDFNRNLNSGVFPGLGFLELPPPSGFGMPPGSASIGRSDVAFKYEFTIIDSYFLYGVTDRLTAGIYVPYWWAKNKVNARLDTSNATVGKNPFFGTPGDPFGGAPLIPLSLAKSLGMPIEQLKLTTEDVQNLLGKGLDVNGDGIIDIPGFKYKRFQTWSDNGVSDLEAGFRYQYLKTNSWRLAFTGGVRFPTGEVDDLDNLVDYGFGTGAYALLFRFHNDYTGIKNLLLNATFRYDLYLPDRQLLRVPDNVDQPITINEEKVRRHLGDIIELEASGRYEFLKGLNLSLLYKYGFKQKDHISGEKGFAYESLELETNYTEHIYIVGLCYSTVPLYLEKKFSVPLTASLSYRNRFAGSNNVLKSQYLAFGLQVYF